MIKKFLHHVGQLKRKRNNVLFGSAIFLIVLAVFLFSYKVGFVNIFSYIKNPISSVGKGIILFEGKDCDHCITVDTFITKNNVQDKIVFTRLEVFNDVDNADILIDKARICGLDSSQIGVPFLWDGSRCILGDVDVINFFKEKMAQKAVKPWHAIDELAVIG